MKKIQTIVFACAMTFLSALVMSTPAQAATDVVCTSYTIGGGSGTYPYNGSAFRCKNTATGLQPTDGGSTTTFNEVANLPANIKSLLTSKNVKYFYFNSRSDALSYFSNTAPYTGLVTVHHQFADAQSRCGNTGFGQDVIGNRYIAVAIYNECSLSNLTPPQVIANNAIAFTMRHELGHAFDFALNTTNALGDIHAVASSTLTAVKLYDLDKLTPSAPIAWTSMTAAQKNYYVCSIWPNQYTSSLIEQDLGYPAVTAGESPPFNVCDPGYIRKPFFVTGPNGEYTPKTIATKKMAYMVNSNAELFAQLFSLKVFGRNSPTNFLAFTERGLNLNQNEWLIQGPAPGNQQFPRVYNCARVVIDAFVANPALPSPPVMPAGCPAYNKP